MAAPGQLDERALLEALRGPDVRTLVGALADLPATTPVAAACTGTLALAEAGLLDGRRCTTGWWLTALFRRRYPRSRLDTDAMVVADGRVTTAGAAFAHVDLALALVRGVGLDLAETVARSLLIDQRPAQSSYAALGHLARHDPLVAAFERHVRAHLAHPTDIGAVARTLGTSRRTLERRVEATVGLSPLRMVRRLRVEHARHLLATTDRSTEDVAHQVGYLNAATLRTLLRRDGTAARPGRGGRAD